MDITTLYLSIHPSEGISAISTFWLLWIMQPWPSVCKQLFKSLLSKLLCIYPEVEMLNQMVILCLTFWGNIVFHSSYTISHSHQQGARVPVSPHPPQHCCFFVWGTFYDVSLMGMKGHLIMVCFFYFILLYNTVLVLLYINMNPPRVYTCSQSWTPSHLPPHTIPLGHPSAPAPSILYPASNLDWRFVSYMILYMFQCHSHYGFDLHFPDGWWHGEAFYVLISTFSVPFLKHRNQMEE